MIRQYLGFPPLISNCEKSWRSRRSKPIPSNRTSIELHVIEMRWKSRTKSSSTCQNGMTFQLDVALLNSFPFLLHLLLRHRRYRHHCLWEGRKERNGRKENEEGWTKMFNDSRRKTHVKWKRCQKERSHLHCGNDWEICFIEPMPDKKNNHLPLLLPVIAVLLHQSRAWQKELNFICAFQPLFFPSAPLPSPSLQEVKVKTIQVQKKISVFFRENLVGKVVKLLVKFPVEILFWNLRIWTNHHYTTPCPPFNLLGEIHSFQESLGAQANPEAFLLKVTMSPSLYMDFSFDRSKRINVMKVTWHFNLAVRSSKPLY